MTLKWLWRLLTAWIVLRIHHDSFVKSEMYEKAMTYFERAAEIQPKDVKWHLMVASCLRRLNSPERVEAAYREIHEKFPDNIEALVRCIWGLGTLWELHRS